MLFQKKTKQTELDINYFSKSSAKWRHWTSFNSELFPSNVIFPQWKWDIVWIKGMAEIQTKIKYTAISFQIIKGCIFRSTYNMAWLFGAAPVFIENF